MWPGQVIEVFGSDEFKARFKALAKKIKQI
jgi:hypothetical protein